MDMDALPCRPALADKFKRGERFASLDLVLAVAKHGPAALSGVTMGDMDNPLTKMALHGVDWNVPLAAMNEWMDRFVATAIIADPKERARSSAKIEAEVQALAAGVKEPWSIVGAILSRRRASEKVGDVFIALISPAIASVFQAESRIQTNEDLLRVGLVLARYKADKGEYPEKLEELGPVHLKAVPTDAFAGTAFVYKKRPDGYLLYSLGATKWTMAGRDMTRRLTI